MDDLVLYGAAGVAVLFASLLLLAAGVIWGLAWLASTFAAGRFDLVTIAALVLGAILTVYWVTGLVLARLGIL
ncbi:MAG: hypothetical protein A4E35_02277 [Methanoregula sp. PtaU1.Bin051]|nr:MAG: hypothetical protein A4E35_02277 [Methanoregula sp. PtaU1.Bin051]